MIGKDAQRCQISEEKSLLAVRDAAGIMSIRKSDSLWAHVNENRSYARATDTASGSSLRHVLSSIAADISKPFSSSHTELISVETS